MVQEQQAHSFPRPFSSREDAAKFKAAGEALAAQYSAYRPLPDLAINGELALGENIADLA